MESKPCKEQEKMLESLGFILGDLVDDGISWWWRFGVSICFANETKPTRGEVLDDFARACIEQGKKIKAQSIKHALGIST